MVLVLHANLISYRVVFVLKLVAFTRATLVVLCRGENGKPFRPAEL